MVTLSPIARDTPLSAVNGVGEYCTVVAKVGFVVNIVTPFLFISTVVLFVVPGVPTCKSVPNTRIGNNAVCWFITFVSIAEIEPALANFKINLSVPTEEYFKLPTSILAMTSPIIVNVVFGAPYVCGIDCIAHLITPDSAHLKTVHFPNEYIVVLE